MQKLLIVSCLLLCSQAWASGRSWECQTFDGILMVGWESGGGNIAPFRGKVAVTPFHSRSGNQILSHELSLVERNQPGEPAKYVLEGQVVNHIYQATVQVTGPFGAVTADLVNLTTGEAEHYTCNDF